MTTCCLPTPIPLVRPWHVRLRDALADLRLRLGRAPAACHLPARTLDDIAAGDDLRQAAALCRTRQAHELAVLRARALQPW